MATGVLQTLLDVQSSAVQAYVSYVEPVRSIRGDAAVRFEENAQLFLACKPAEFQQIAVRGNWLQTGGVQI